MNPRSQQTTVPANVCFVGRPTIKLCLLVRGYICLDVCNLEKSCKTKKKVPVLRIEPQGPSRAQTSFKCLLHQQTKCKFCQLVGGLVCFAVCFNSFNLGKN